MKLWRRNVDFLFFQEEWCERIPGRTLFFFAGCQGRKPVHDSPGFGFSLDIVDNDSLFLDNNSDIIMPECQDVYPGIIGAGFNNSAEFRHIRADIQ